MMLCHFWRNRYFKLTVCSSALLGLILIVIHHVSSNHFDPDVYPLQGDVIKYINQIRLGEKPDITPINLYEYSYLLSNESKCLDSNGKLDKIDFLILVKSALTHRAKRRAIRETWGQESQLSSTTIRTAFLLGTNPHDNELQQLIQMESKQYGDIIQSDFIDSYNNNTVKTMQGMKWVVKKCKFAKYILFADDDMYVSIKNILNFANEFVNYNTDPDLLYVGRFSQQLTPERDPSNKWYISYEDYPYTNYPPYIPAGAYLLTYEALLRLFYGSMYTKHLDIDDVYLGIVAQKVNVPITNNDKFFGETKVEYNKYKFNSVISSHGFYDPDFLFKVWREQQMLSNA